MRKLLCVILALCLLLNPNDIEAQEPGPVFRIDPPLSTVRRGQQFTISITVEDTGAWHGFYLSLFLYDPAIVTVDTVEPGKFIKEWWSEWGWEVTWNDVIVSIEVPHDGLCCPYNYPPPPSGSGEVAVIHLTAHQEGQDTLNLYADIRTSYYSIGPATAENGSVIVNYSVFLPQVAR